MEEKKNFTCFGDSITSDEVSGIGTTTAGVLGMNLIGNFAHGNATCSDWYNSDKRLTAVNFNIVPNQWHPDNVLSNQVLKLLRDMTPTGKPVCWTHPECGEFSVNACGTGSIKSKPDVIYIAIGANDGKEEQGNATPIFDNCDEVFRQKYSELTKKGIASALRWAIETLKCSFEDCFIFVASPLQANSPWEPSAFKYAPLYQKRSIIKKVCEYCSVYFIDSFTQSGFSQMRVKKYGDECGVHPIGKEKKRLAEFIAHKIEMELY